MVTLARVFLGLTLSLVIFIGCASDRSGESIASYFPNDNDTDDWIAIDTVRTFVGQDLFLMINGGAETYHENGFVQVASQTFKNQDNHQISIEIYEMKSSVGSHTMYRSKISPGGEALNIGEAATLNGYYLNFYQENILVTLVGFDNEPGTVEGLKSLAATIATNSR